MENIEENHPYAEALLKRRATSVARSLIRGNQCAVDKTIEETFTKNAKSRGRMGGGGTGLLRIIMHIKDGSRLFTNGHFNFPHG